jgi:very-short-patch-repair endonuclease
MAKPPKTKPIVKETFENLEEVERYQRYLGHRRKKIKDKILKVTTDLALRETPAEIHFKKLLNELGISYQFQRVIHFPKDNYSILDFYLPDHGIYIELDGDHHYQVLGLIKDIYREQKLSKVGFKTFIRFSNEKALELNSQGLLLALKSIMK